MLLFDSFALCSVLSRCSVFTLCVPNTKIAHFIECFAAFLFVLFFLHQFSGQRVLIYFQLLYFNWFLSLSIAWIGCVLSKRVKRKTRSTNEWNKMQIMVISNRITIYTSKSMVAIATHRSVIKTQFYTHTHKAQYGYYNINWSAYVACNQPLAALSPPTILFTQ